MKNTFEYVLLSIISLLVTIILFVLNLGMYTIFTIALFVIFLILIFINIFSNKSDDQLYDSILNKILKTYAAIMVESEELPSIKKKNIVKVASLENLITAQAEVRKPIFYKKEFDSCTFILLDNKEVMIYSLKRNEDVVVPIEAIILEERLANKKTSKEELLDGIDSTTIIELDNDKAFKISPIRKKGEEPNAISDTQLMSLLKDEYMPKLKK